MSHLDQISQDTFRLQKDIRNNLLNSRCFSRNYIYPDGTSPLDKGPSIGDGVLRHEDGYILKPLSKKELKFYQDLQEATDQTSIELREFVPEFFGTVTMHYDETDIEYLILKNASVGYSDPCIMDIKIGKQTWEPDATKEEIEGEQQKYGQYKEELGFCIPGFQVHRLSSGKLVKMGREYGKRLNKSTIKDAMKLFLNADSGLNRELLIQFLASLWKLMGWYRKQRKFKIYSSSLLLIYDAKKLRQCLNSDDISQPVNHKAVRPLTLKICNGNGAPSSPGFGATMRFPTPQSPDQLSASGTIMENPQRCSSSSGGSVLSTPTTPTTPFGRSVFGQDSWHVVYDKLRRTHSFTNNYEKDLQYMKVDYVDQLDDLICADNPSSKGEWASVKMIDFAHVFPASPDEPDTNYLDGLENLIRLFENLMSEAI